MKVFISYRRADSNDIVGRIYDRLIEKFGFEEVFKDVNSIPLGLDFRRIIDAAVGNCQILLAVIGQHWLSVTESDGSRRLNNPTDYVRLEIESALARSIPVIPVLVKGAKMPSAKDLPSQIKDLAYRNGIQVRFDPDFHQDMDRLIEGIETVLTTIDQDKSKMDNPLEVFKQEKKQTILRDIKIEIDLRDSLTRDIEAVTMQISTELSDLNRGRLKAHKERLENERLEVEEKIEALYKKLAEL